MLLHALVRGCRRVREAIRESGGVIYSYLIRKREVKKKKKPTLRDVQVQTAYAFNLQQIGDNKDGYYI